MKQITLTTLEMIKQAGEKFTMLTAYDATFSHVVSSAGVETILIGDSLGMVMQGHTTTIPTTVGDIAYHTRCVAQGNQGSLLIGDFPFMAHATPELAINTATTLMQAGAHMVKIEGGEWLCDTITKLTQLGIPVCAHLGLTPQSIHKLGGYKVQGRDKEQARQIISDARALENAGARLLVLECVPSSLAKDITEQLSIPTVGIGAGPHTDAQVLVLQDMLGITPNHTPKFARNFMSEVNGNIQKAIHSYIEAVKEGSFPGPEEVYE